MARSSSAKKVARAARAGSGRRSRQTSERNLLFPLVMVGVVILGVLSVVWARDERDQADDPVVAEDTDLRVAYGIYICDSFVPNLPSDLQIITTTKVRTFGDGLLYVPTGEIGSATLGDAFDEADVDFDDESITLPNGTTAVAGETTCGDGDETGELRVVKWDSLLDDTPSAVATSDLRDVVLDQEGQSITIAFVPPGTADADIPRPPSDVELGTYLGIDVEPSAQSPAGGDTADEGTADEDTGDEPATTSAPTTTTGG